MKANPSQILLFLAACAVPACSEPDSPAERIFLITCDTLRADRLGIYGYEPGVSPHLDAFARQCVVFSESYSSAPMTQPAVSSLLSGRLPREIGTIPGNLRLMPPAVETLAERLRTSGMTTAAVISNWILRRQSEDQGDVGVQQGFDHFDDRMRFSQKNTHVRERTAGLTTDAAIEWLNSRETDNFFLWVHYQDPHGPYTPPPRFASSFRSPRGLVERVEVGDDKLGQGQIPAYQSLGGSSDPAVYRDRYDAEICYFDSELGRLFDRLDEEDLIEDALTVFSADHGEALGEHDYWFCHGESVHREIVRIPFLVRWPGGRIPEGYDDPGSDGIRRCPRLASHLDFMPTALDAVGLFDREARGVSLYGGPPPLDRVLPQDLFPAEGRPRWWSASDGRHRLVWSESFEGERLYDITIDPAEEDDLSPQHPELVSRLRAAHEAFLAGGTSRKGSTMQLDNQDHAALDALGYGGYAETDSEEDQPDREQAEKK